MRKAPQRPDFPPAYRDLLMKVLRRALFWGMIGAIGILGCGTSGKVGERGAGRAVFSGNGHTGPARWVLLGEDGGREGS